MEQQIPMDEQKKVQQNDSSVFLRTLVRLFELAAVSFKKDLVKST